jgi:hypothetical protein
MLIFSATSTEVGWDCGEGIGDVIDIGLVVVITIGCVVVVVAWL